MSERIEKPWVVCEYGFFYAAIGKVIKDRRENSFVQDSEGQVYRPQFWRAKCLTRFETSSEAVEYFSDCFRDIPRRKVIENFLLKFPSEREHFQGINPGKFGKDLVMGADGKPVHPSFVQ